jgi:NSS family neurotransmitter:Na+ symporter
MSDTPKFRSRLGLLAATIGSAVGLGNVWRFPAEVQEGGGATFLVVYILCILALGLPVMLAEFSLGRGTGADTVAAYTAHLSDTPKTRRGRSAWTVAGSIALVASYLITAFYMVVAAWILQYLWASLTGGLYEGEVTEGMWTARLKQTIGAPYSPICWTLVVLMLNAAVLLRGVREGIERLSGWLMPLLFVLLLILCGVSLTLPGAADGISYFLRPDFSRLTPSVIVRALGQSFFSLSLGMGILVTYSAYFPRTTRLGRTAVTVVLGDFLVAFLVGLVIFPAVMSFAAGGELNGPALIFVTLPEVFAHMPFPALWSGIFFLFLFIAALTSTLSLTEVSVRCVERRYEKRRGPDRQAASARRVAVACVILPLVILSPLCSLSVGGYLPTLCGCTLFDLLDTIATNYMLPIAGCLTCIYVGWVLPPSFLRRELPSPLTARVVRWMLRYMCPLLMLIILLSGV